MEDPQVVAAIVAGDPAGLAAAYDRYARPLYAYCRTMLPEPADAVDAVQDTFLVAATELRGLREPTRLRPWLYAVARTQCLTRLRTRTLYATLDEAADLPADSETADPELMAEQADRRALLRGAIGALNPGDRDIIELSLVHGLEGGDLVDVLGVSRNHAHALVSRARGQLEKSLGALIVARGGRQDCPGLDHMLAGWDGRLTILARKRISRHIEQCPTCGEHRRRQLRPTLLAGLVPLAAAGPGFAEQVARMVADHSPAGAAHRIAAARLAGPFRSSGFPRAVTLPHAPSDPGLRHLRALTAGTATSAASVVVIGAVVVLGGSHHPGPPPAAGVRHSAAIGTGRGPGTRMTTPALRVAAFPGPATLGPPGSASAVPSPSAGSGTPTGVARSVPPSLSPTTAPPSTAPSSTAAPTPSPSTPSTGTPAPSPSAPAPSPPPSPGTLTVTPTVLDPVVLNGTTVGTVTLTAVGGPVSDYTVSVGAALAGEVAVSPSSGSLAAGGSVTITVTVTSLLVLNAQLTINPGGQTVLVMLGV